MAQTIRRNARTVRRQARMQDTRTKVRKARAQTNSLVDGLMRYLPFTEEQLQRAFLVLIVASGLALAWLVASLAGLTLLAGQKLAAVSADAGFEVRRVEVRGAERMNELKVYDRVLAEREQAMTMVDLAQLRASVMELSWVREARVSRQLPDTIVVDIVERKPHAVLRRPDRYVLIDETGHELEPVEKGDIGGMLVVSGPGAQQQVEALARLLDAAPALRPQVSGAEWVGNRRWNLTFKTDQVLGLPEGERRAASALISFARLDGVHRLLGGKVASFDMRTPEKIYMRVPGRAQQELTTGEGS